MKTMLCFELRAALEDMGLKPTVLAKVCGVEYVEAWRWVEGQRKIPKSVRIILTLMKTRAPSLVLTGHLLEWEVKRRHVYRDHETFKDLLKRWHPDANRRDTTGEMQVINQFRG